MAPGKIASELLPGNVVLVRAAGSLDATAFDAFQQAFESHLVASRSRFVVDLAGVDYIGSSCVTVLTSTLSAVQASGGNLVIAGISKPVRQVFDVLCIGPLFTVADSVASAQARFG